MSSSNHTAKKPYAGVHSQQSTITTFFSRATPSSSSSVLSTSEHHDQTDSLGPSLPPSVQANLLSVGMRIRKSVPEGYKTGTYSAFGLFSDNGSVIPSSWAEQIARQYRSATTAGMMRELTPFCGILKTGGYAQQFYNENGEDEVHEQGFGAGEQGDDYGVPAEDDVPFLSSQGSTATDVSVPEVFGNANGNSHKRRFDLDVEEPPMVTRQWLDDELISPLSSAAPPRPMAVPKSRRVRVLGSNGTSTTVTPPTLMGSLNKRAPQDQENTLDFGEAEFLDYGNFREVEMMDG